MKNIFKEIKMKTKITLLAIITAIIFMFSGCENSVEYRPLLTPPQGISVLALDNQVLISWDYHYYNNVYGYNVYVNSSYNGNYTLIGTTTTNEFYDNNARNGFTYYYAVTAYDGEGNESDLSVENLSATPRTKTFDLVLYDRYTAPDISGYEFISNSILPYDHDNADLYIEIDNNLYYMLVYRDTEIQDMGYTASFDEIRYSPTQGWSPLKKVLLIEGHTYVICTYDNHFAKIRIKEFNSNNNNIVMDCSYQSQTGNIQLKRSPQKDKRIYETTISGMQK
jgi:hypothetical protein